MNRSDSCVSGLCSPCPRLKPALPPPPGGRLVRDGPWGIPGMGRLPCTAICRCSGSGCPRASILYAMICARSWCSWLWLKGVGAEELLEPGAMLWLPRRFCCGRVWTSTPSSEAELEPEVDRRGPDGGPLADTGLDTCSEEPSGDRYPAGGDTQQ